MLILPIKKKWFDMIKSGEKKEEYREIKPYYDKCLGKAIIGFPFTKAIIENFKSIRAYDKRQFKTIDIIFRNGYINDTTGILREITFKKKYSGKRCQWAGIIGHAMIWNPVGWIVGLKEGEPLSIKSGTEGVATLKYGFQINKKI